MLVSNFISKRLNINILNKYKHFSSSTQNTVDTSTTQNLVLNTVSNLDSKKLNKKSKKTSLNVQNDELSKPTEPSSDLSESQDKSLVFRKPIPKNFIKETLLPHLEHNVAYNCMKFPPEVVLQIGIAYSKLPHFIRQRSIEDALVEAFRFRMVDYTASECVQLLNTCLQLQGLRSVNVYDDIISRLEVPHVYNSINSLNRLGICRSISRIVNHSHSLTSDTHSLIRSNVDDSVVNSTHSDTTNSTKNSSLDNINMSQPQNYNDIFSNKDIIKFDFNKYHDRYTTSPIRPWSYIVKNYKDKRISALVDRLVSFCENRILPQLEYDIKSFDSDELTDLLAVLAQRTERDGSTLDFPVISILMSNIMRLYPSTSLLNTLNNLSSLCRLRIRHDEFLNNVLNDLRNPLKVTNIFHRHLSRCVWTLARFDLLNDVIPNLLPNISRNVPKFEPSCFARLSQVSKYYNFSNETKYNQFRNILLKVCLCILTKIESLNPKDIIFYLSGLMNLHLLPDELQYNIKTKIDIKPKFDKDERYLQRNQKSTTNFILLDKVINTLKSLDSDFDLLEIQRLVDNTKLFSEYRYLVDHFPKSWCNIINPS